MHDRRAHASEPTGNGGIINCLRANKKEAPDQAGMARNSKSTQPKHSALRKATSTVQTSSDQYALAPTVARLTGEEAVVLGSMKNWKASNDRHTYASEASRNKKPTRGTQDNKTTDRHTKTKTRQTTEVGNCRDDPPNSARAAVSN